MKSFLEYITEETETFSLIRRALYANNARHSSDKETKKTLTHWKDKRWKDKQGNIWWKEAGYLVSSNGKTRYEIVSEETIKLTSKQYDELWMLEYDTLDSNSPAGKKVLAKALKNAKKKGASYIITLDDTTYLLSAIDNTIDILRDQDKNAVAKGFEKLRSKLT